MPDDLKREIEEITQEAAEVALTIVLGTFDDKKLPAVQWETNSPFALKAYLAVAKNLGCSLIVLEKYEFGQEAMEVLKPEEPESEDGEGAKDDSEFEAKWNKLAKEYAAYYGSLYAFVIYYFRDGICYSYERESSWYTKLAESADSLRSEYEAAMEEEEEIPELTQKEIEEIASELARDEMFQKAANQNARRFAFKKNFPKVAEEHPYQVSEIIGQANGIFELEIEPEMEKALDNRISDLVKQGLDKEQIAKKLKISVSRVKKAL